MLLHGIRNQYLLCPNTDHKQEVTYMYSIKEICSVMIKYWTFGRCDYQLVFNINPKTLDKGERLEYGESMMTHAMVLTAVSEKQVSCHKFTNMCVVTFEVFTGMIMCCYCHLIVCISWNWVWRTINNWKGNSLEKIIMYHIA